MKRRRIVRIGLILAGVALVVAVVLLWPAPDPLAGVETVAVRVGSSSRPAGLDVQSELDVILGDRNIRIVSDESAADMVLELTDFTVNLGNIEISLTDGSFRGRATAVCTLTDPATGKTYLMDFVIEVQNDRVRADLVARKFWQFWKPQPSR